MSSPALDQRQLRSVLGTFTTGVTVITTQRADGRPVGVTANSFTSVSLDPPLVLWSQALTSKSLDAYKGADNFAVNILAEDQIDVSNRFATSGEEKFAGVSHRLGELGVPLIDGSAAQIECRKVATWPGGDHIIYLGQVERIVRSGRRPLAFLGGRYMVPYAHDMGPVSLRVDAQAQVDAGLLRRFTQALPDAAEAIGQHTLCLAVWGNHGPTVVHWEPSAQPVSQSLPTGLVLSITATACGKAFAAWLPSPCTESFIREDLRIHRRDDDDEASQRASFEQELERIRKEGVATSVDAATTRRVHGIGTTAFAVPIFDDRGRMVIAIGLVASSERPGLEPGGAVQRALTALGEEFSRRNGFNNTAIESSKQ